MKLINMETIYILGRQDRLGLAELEAVYGQNVTEITPGVAMTSQPEASRPICSAVKTAKLITSFPLEPWQNLSNKIIHYLSEALPSTSKVTLGISVYGQRVEIKKIQSIGLNLKRQRQKAGNASLRLIPNQSPTLNSAQVLHNKLTRDNKWELLIIFTNDDQIILAKTSDVQDITAYAKRDRGRPRRDTRVGMLPPKLAQTMINLALECSVTSGSDSKLALPESKTFDPAKKRLSETKVTERSNHKTLLDPFCGTGVVLQEAALMGLEVYGTDIEQRMIDYTEENLQWLKKIYQTDFKQQLAQGDATNAKWQQPIDLVATETYLGRPFTSEPSSDILQKTIADCNLIIKKFLQNIAAQTKPGTRFCVAVPAWFVKNKVYHLSLLDDLRNIGYNRLDFKHASFDDLIYHREGQIVGRELLVLTRR